MHLCFRRDALFLGDCDAGVRQLCQLLGREEDLEALMAAGRAQFEQSRTGGSEGVEDAVPGGGGSTEAVMRATAEAAAAAEAAVPAAKAAAAAACRPTHLEELKDLGAQLLVVARQEVKHLVL